MAGLFTMAVGRHPKPAPAAVAEQASIHTHPWNGPGPAPMSAMRRALAAPADATDATDADLPRRTSDEPRPAPEVGTPSVVHDRLYAAWLEKDWGELAAIARHHLAASGPEPRMHKITAAAVAFFQPWATDLQAGDTERFLRKFPDGEVRAYIGEEAERERQRLADDALALQCLGMLGQARFDYAGALRAMEALTVSARLMDLGGDELGISAALIRQIGDMDVFLPHWCFEIDICRRSDSDEGWPRESPLERKIARRARRDTDLAQDLDCDCTPEAAICTPPDPCCAEVHYYIADLLELRDWTHRYKAGDLAYIENVAPGEKRRRKHEMKRTRELFSETEATDRQSETRDLQVTARASLKREIERQKESSLSGEASATGSYNAKVYSATVSASASFARSSSEAIREAQENAVETVKKAVSEIEKETRTKRSEKITTEETEKNLHAFTNTTDEALVTKYFWVTKECRAQLYSYGRQMIAEFIVPEPARLYERLLHLRREEMIDQRVTKPKATEPVAPAAIGFTASSLTPENYKGLAAQWGVQDPPAPPAPATSLPLDYSEGEDREDGVHVADLPFQVPDGYQADSWNFDGEAKYRLVGNPKKVSATCGGSNLQIGDGQQTYGPLPNLTGSQSVSLFASRTDSFEVTAIIYMQLLPGGLAPWQQAVFGPVQEKHDALMAAYAEKKAKYDEIIAAYEAEKNKVRQELIENELSRHPFFNREIEQTELKRAVIYLMCQDFSVDGAMIRKAALCGLPEIDRTATDKLGYEWYFWDRLIDWKRMAYAFFDYFWNPMCDWPKRFDPDEPDVLFKAFLRAGYARVLVPVSPAMHKDFLWYLATHEKWNQQGPPFGDQDPRWRNVVFEAQAGQ